jgi:hypothetical protein
MTMVRVTDTICSPGGLSTMLIIDPAVQWTERPGRYVTIGGERFEMTFVSSATDRCVDILGTHENLVGKDLIFNDVPRRPKD